jgi:hypothetical protein
VNAAATVPHDSVATSTLVLAAIALGFVVVTCVGVWWKDSVVKQYTTWRRTETFYV